MRKKKMQRIMCGILVSVLLLGIFVPALSILVG